MPRKGRFSFLPLPGLYGYGMPKIPRKSRTSPPRKSGAAATAERQTGFKIKLRGKDNAPLSMAELRQGFYDIVRKLKRYETCRAKWVTVYLTLVDDDGQEVRINEKGEWTIYPYRSAADEKGA